MFLYSRLNDIYDYISKEKITPIKNLCELLNITDRTLRTDVQNINTTLQNNGAIIKLKRKCGYYIEVFDKNKFNIFLDKLSYKKSNVKLDSSKDRIKYLLNLLLYSNNYISLDMLSELIFVSTNTLKNYIKSLNNIFLKYNLELINKSNLGIKIIGNEDNKRKCLVENILSDNFQNYIANFSKEEYNLFKDIDLNKLKNIVYKKLKDANIQTNDFNFKNLVIHFALMISRIKYDYYINNNFNIKIDENYKDFINDICIQIENNFNVTISEGEKNYIYSHLVANTHINNLINNNIKIKEIISDLLKSIYLDYNFDLRNDEILLNDLFAHFKSILNTKYLALNKRNPLLNTIKCNFPLAFDITLTSITKVFNSLPYILTEDEIGYISLHIAAGIERCFSGSLKPKNVILVCGSGQATTRMLEARINIFFKDKINIINHISYNDFINYNKNNFLDIDFIISTIPINIDFIPFIVVDFMLKTEDIEAISKFLTNISSNKIKKCSHFFDKDLFFYLNSISSKEELLYKASDIMKKKKIVNSDYINFVIERENLSKTNMNEIFALPHPLKLCANETKVAVAILDEPLIWNDNATVQIIFLLAIKQGEQLNIEYLYDIFIEIINNTKLQQSILQSNNFDLFINNLSKYIN